jgi:hypothetical protein
MFPKPYPTISGLVENTDTTLVVISGSDMPIATNMPVEVWERLNCAERLSRQA